MSKLLKNDVLCVNDHFFNGNVARKIPVTYFWALYQRDRSVLMVINTLII